MNIDKDDFMREIYAVRNIDGGIEFDFNRGYVLLKQLQFPEGWSPRTGKILYILPDDYRQSPPDVYIPSGLSYHGRKPHAILAIYDPPDPFNDDDWARYDTHIISWNPDRHSLVTTTKILYGWMKRPSSSDPWKR